MRQENRRCKSSACAAHAAPNTNTTGCWAVWREDGNANRFVVRSGLTYAGAKALVRRGRKQFYWCSPAGA